MGKKKHYPLDAATLAEVANGSPDADRCNRQLLYWLSDDGLRNELFTRINKDHHGKLPLPSRDASPRECDGLGYDVPRAPAVVGHRPVTLVTDREQIKAILINEWKEYSSRIYAELGGGNFMLALDPASGAAHKAQRDAFHACFPSDPTWLQALAHAACNAAGVMAFRQPDFDLAETAEQAGLRFVQMLMGYPLGDYPLLQRALGAAYKGLVYQVFERHFVTDPTLIPQARQQMGALLARTARLIDAYAADDEDALRGCADPARPPGQDPPVLARLGALSSNLNGEQRAVIALGAAIGSVGNVQAAACIVLKALFADSAKLTAARTLAGSEPRDRPSQRQADWIKLLSPPLRANPPIPYLPRLTLKRDGTTDREFLLALGGGTAAWTGAAAADDPLVWGLPGTGQNTGAPHNCAGQILAWPLLIEIVRQVLALPGLAQALDSETGLPHGLTQRHGFACESYPLTHRRDHRRAQTSLNVAMRLRPPLRDNADRVREIIRSGAPRIEHLLRCSRHVHFAWFELIENDSVLVLHTVYDGPFGAYLQHFALEAGDLFDKLFECIADPPPSPVAKFPTEFAAHLLRYDRPPAMGYFFSAYPSSEVARIVRDEGRGP